MVLPFNLVCLPIEWAIDLPHGDRWKSSWSHWRPVIALLRSHFPFTEWPRLRRIVRRGNVIRMIHEMSEHRFQIGEKVIATAYGAPPGPYSITRQLPADHGELSYRGKSLIDNHERALGENALRLQQSKAQPNIARPPRKRTASR